MLTLYLAATTGLTLISFFILKVFEIKNQYEEEKLKVQLSLEAAKKREREAKEKLHRAKSILQRIEQEFRVISSTIDWLKGSSPADFQCRYQDLQDKSNEAQMLLAFYAPTLQESVEQLDNLLNDYWIKLYRVLVGEKIARTTQDDLEVVERSQLIITRISSIRQKVAELIS